MCATHVRPGECLSFEELLAVLDIIFALGRDRHLNVHFRPQMDFCFRHFPPDMWRVVAPLGPRAVGAMAEAMGVRGGEAAAAAARFPHTHASSDGRSNGGERIVGREGAGPDNHGSKPLDGRSKGRSEEGEPIEGQEGVRQANHALDPSDGSQEGRSQGREPIEGREGVGPANHGKGRSNDRAGAEEGGLIRGLSAEGRGRLDRVTRRDYEGLGRYLDPPGGVW